MAVHDKEVQISYASAHTDENVRIQGWIDNIRRLKNVTFLVLKDDTGQMQVVCEKGSDLHEIVNNLSKGSTVEVTGKVVKNVSVKMNPYELQPTGIEITSMPVDTYQLDSAASLETRLDYRHLDLRNPKNKLIFQVQTAIEHAMREYWIRNGFIEIHSPKLVSGASESGAELFQLDYFGQTASLAQSPQFYKQMAMTGGLGKVFEIGPVFRANPSFTSRHDTEFTSIDVEISWIKSHEDVMAFEENWLQYVLSTVNENYGAKIKESFGVEVKVPEVPFPRMTMAESRSLLRSLNYEIPDEQKGDLDPQGERLLGESIKSRHDHEFVFVTDYPVNVRPFYHMRHASDPALTKSFDLLWKGLEITTGAQREHRYEKLFNQANEKGVDTTSIASYLNFFKNGCPPHGGFGFGLTRMLMNLLETKNVREVTYVYRGPNRLTP